jgi:hypothetical protein
LFSRRPQRNYYNHLNLPTKITVTNKGTIEYCYDGAGTKTRKVLKEISRLQKIAMNLAR